MNIFKERNPELLLVEQVKPRSCVTEFDQWQFGEGIPDFTDGEEELAVRICSDDSSDELVISDNSTSDDGRCETCSDSSDDNCNL